MCRLQFNHAADTCCGLCCISNPRVSSANALLFVQLQNGQLMYYGHLPHNDPLLCPVAADGAYQLARYGVKGHPFPDFSGDPKLWYGGRVTDAICRLLRSMAYAAVLTAAWC
jgi:hypothetical protein